ncbi:hypothetical protein BRD00_09575 [Halobacteriales archaeon QS_8_69_26]|nr:MAG: hypothetical protein BRD00_09575 [Halobacteriales archaeon QS_8_69_26]
MTRSDYLTFAVAVAVVLAAVVGVAAAVEVTSEDVPEETEVDSPTRVSVTLENLYADYEEWTLVASTQLEDARWNVTYYDQTGAVVDGKEVEGQNYNGIGISPDKDIARVVVEVDGTTPAVGGNYTYDGQNTFAVLRLSQDPANGGVEPPFQTWETVHYTQDSSEARQALDSAQAAIDDAKSSGVDVSEAERLFDNAVRAYQRGNFENAKDLADQAQTSAENAQNKSESESEQMQLILLGIGAIVAIALVGGGIYYYREQQKDQTRLR